MTRFGGCWRAVLVSLLAGSVAGSALPALRLRDGVVHRTEAGHMPLVGRGRRLYAAYCAACHGRALQGQPLWQVADAGAGRRAPALDETGFAWLRSDDGLFRIIRDGATATDSRRGQTMPAFGRSLDDGDILAVTAFIKARWPIGLRVLQAARNPGTAGMPPEAAQGGWRFPPTCVARLPIQYGEPGG